MGLIPYVLCAIVVAARLVSGPAPRAPVHEGGVRHTESAVMQGQGRVPSFVEQTGQSPPALHENSGVAVSRSHPGIIWSHNDSGDGPVLYALDLAGKLWARFRLRGAQARDWEDLARGACPAVFERVDDCLFVGDIGDNGERRRTYQIYVLPEPDPTTGSGGVRLVDGARRITFRYPDGPHNAESLAVTARGDLLVIVKVRRGGTPVYRIRATALDRAWERDTVLVASVLDTLAIQPSFFLGHTATGAAVSPSGSRLVVRTYTQLYFYTLDPAERPVPDGAPCLVGGLALVGEGVDFLDEEMVVLTSEAVPSRPGEIDKVRC
jgi:hypothetical protein